MIKKLNNKELFDKASYFIDNMEKELIDQWDQTIIVELVKNHIESKGKQQLAEIATINFLKQYGKDIKKH